VTRDEPVTEKDARRIMFRQLAQQIRPAPTHDTDFPRPDSRPTGLPTRPRKAGRVNYIKAITMNNPLKKIAEAFRSDDLTHQIEAKKSEIERLEKQISVTNAEYFQHKITEPVKAAAVKEKMERLKTELESLRDDVVSLVGTHEKATRGERMAARAKERAAIEKRVAKDLAFLEEYKEMVRRIDAGLNHLAETGELARRFSRDAPDGETAIVTAEHARHAPGTWAIDAQRPLAETVNLPPVRHGDPVRRAIRLA
jgi:hypothetical protein